MISDWNELNQRSHAPYSQKKEACICRSTDGVLFPGIRIENASYPLTIEADQLAVALCLMYGHTPNSVISPKKLRSPGVSSLLKLPHLISQEIPNGSWFSPFTKKQFDSNDLDELKSFCVIKESDFPVTAMIKTNECWVAGANVEFTSWGMGLCAERMALASALALGYHIENEIQIKVFKGGYASPCGACRQVLSEFSPKSRVCTHQNDGNRSVLGLSDLLPYAFIPENLKKNH